MKITKRQLRKLRRIISEEKKRLISEMNPDKTISVDERSKRKDLLYNVEKQTRELITYIVSESENIGGSFRSPGIRKQCFDLIFNIINNYK